MNTSTIQSLISLAKKELHLQNLMKQSYKDIRTHNSQAKNDEQAEKAHRKYQNTGKKIKKLEGTMKELQEALQEGYEYDREMMDQKSFIEWREKGEML